MWLRGYPLYAAHVIVLIYVVLMIVTAVLGGASPISTLAFDSRAVWSGEVWRIFTYGLLNPPRLGFAIDMLMIVWFGREVERTLGRRTFLFFYLGIYLIPTLALTAIGFIRPTMHVGQPGALGVFVGFATLFPGALLFLNILASWAAIILVGIYSLIALAERNSIALALLWSGCGFAFVFIRYQQGRFTLPSLRLWKRRPKLTVLPDLPAKSRAVPAKSIREDATMAEVDALLDKIAKSGMASLTARERAKLEAAREDLMKRSASRE